MVLGNGDMLSNSLKRNKNEAYRLYWVFFIVAQQISRHLTA